MAFTQDTQDEPITTSTVARILGHAENTTRSWDRRGIIHPIAITATGVRIYSRQQIERVRDELLRGK